MPAINDRRRYLRADILRGEDLVFTRHDILYLFKIGYDYVFSVQKCAGPIGHIVLGKGLELVFLGADAAGAPFIGIAIDPGPVGILVKNNDAVGPRRFADDTEKLLNGRFKLGYILHPAYACQMLHYRIGKIPHGSAGIIFCFHLIVAHIYRLFRRPWSCGIS